MTVKQLRTKVDQLRGQQTQTRGSEAEAIGREMTSHNYEIPANLLFIARDLGITIEEVCDLLEVLKIQESAVDSKMAVNSLKKELKKLEEDDR